MNGLIELFNQEGLPSDLIDEIISISEYKKIDNQQVIVQYKQICQELFYVVKGGFIVKYYNENLGSSRTVNFNLDTFQPFMACVDSFYNQVPSEFSIKAFQKSEIIVFQKDKLFDLMNKIVAFKDFYLAQLTNSLIAENDFRVKLITLSPEEMYGFIRDKYPDLTLRVPSKYIAEFIGISPEWLSKIKRKDLIS